MGKTFLVALFFASMLIISGCGEKTIDYSDPNTLITLTEKMSTEEQVHFISDVMVVALALGGEEKLNGYTVSQVTEEAINVRAFIRKKNIKFLEITIPEMEAMGENSISLVEHNGFLSKPEDGDISFKKYSIERLKEIIDKLKSGKNIEDILYKK
ncbi:hypothetical protein [Thiothrix subterranea]|uniref:Lipoprotein n=1 Tax=Thiothrix subterranea TaxID=2735563 RepID=A0AA51MM60_9GAMM|nr:hypothetical protein [Thiothrix subterranea]MDQ5768800.1 hypothetical protein [Thiothrix subterranea]WML86518.1 hypothetical protein RCG00_19820 [Thiothrix subterranea]